MGYDDRCWGRIIPLRRLRKDPPLPEFGAGCHPSRDIALLRALTEAAQARTTFIAGSRDDMAKILHF